MSRGHRPSTTPMDFEWSNQSGPVDPSSPFFAAGQQSAKKRPHSVLDSPSKTGFATPTRLREPDNRPFFFSQDSAAKPLPLPPHVQNAWEPRTPASNYDASSGGETPTTPQIDSDAGTPDTLMSTRLARLGTSEASSPKKTGRRDSWFKRAFMPNSPSPTKDRERDRDTGSERERDRERDREKDKDSQKYYSKKLESRITKRRTERPRSKKRAAHRDEQDSDDQSAAPSSEQGPVQRDFTTNAAGFFHWIEAHPDLPSVLSYYLQLALNTFFVCAVVYLARAAWKGILTDVEIESNKHTAEIIAQISGCALDYNRNRCHPDQVVPAMERACSVWETCMNRDPKKVASASVTARTFAKIFNSFVDEFTYKSMGFTVVVIFGGLNFSNWAFGLFRAQRKQQLSNHNEFVPQTPHRVPSNGYIDYSQQGYQQNWQQNTPYQTPYGSTYMNPPPLLHTQSMPALPSTSEEGVGLIEDRKSPKKRGLFR
ncbi:hypothetical protein IQ07DRAFT_616295 [Pyrenochaeta sp. DS3sAY3a]|nr:hypothetical protein IQ07DRAFT_616295 [Pyrenochaeta sp. DS3sAY3a]